MLQPTPFPSPLDSTPLSWYVHEMRRTLRPALDRVPADRSQQRGTVQQYFSSEACVLCDSACRRLLCDACAIGGGAAAAFALLTRRRLLEVRATRVVRHCMQCAGEHERHVECVSVDCPTLYARLRIGAQAAAARAHAEAGLEQIEQAAAQQQPPAPAEAGAPAAGAGSSLVAW
jgi:hypothetical protein